MFQKIIQTSLLIGLLGSSIAIMPSSLAQDQDEQDNQTVKVGRLTIDLQDCTRSSSTVRCNFLFSRDTSGNVALTCQRNWCRFYDYDGNVYSSAFTTWNGNLPGQTPRKLSVIFEGIPSRVDRISTLQITVSDTNATSCVFGGRCWRTTFRQIDISKK